MYLYAKNKTQFLKAPAWSELKLFKAEKEKLCEEFTMK